MAPNKDTTGLTEVNLGIPYDNEFPVAQAAVVDVVAPTNLEAGYQFNVETGNGPALLVRVPNGGAVAGQRFAAEVIDCEGSPSDLNIKTNPHNIPTGHWRDALCDCFRLGCCHPLFCLTFWCTSCALGQIMTRAKLDVFGNKQKDPKTYWTPFKILVALTTVYAIIRLVVGGILEKYEDASEDDGSDDDPAWVEGLAFFHFLLLLTFFIFVTVITVKTRRFLRRKHEISNECCGGTEDCCTSFWCLPCTVCQMGRHTADYGRYPASCCTDTGLKEGLIDDEYTEDNTADIPVSEPCLRCK
jgi:Cys-rich protein (TIGR01571 family)